MARKELSSLRIQQWLDQWNDIAFDDLQKRRKPEPFFYFFSINANDLRRLSNIDRRIADKPRVEDIGVQREHREDRSIEISHFIQGGFPWSILSKRQKENNENDKLKMPGWLPTSIIANILAPNTRVGRSELQEKDSIQIRVEDGRTTILLPEGFSAKDWQPDVFPISIIDGQHRLLAFDYLDELTGNFELPVIAFFNLDITWQAYLFYTINIKPKKIKPSLAYDLFPILRTQEWLEESPDGLMVYRETRAQELTEILWTFPESPWFKRVNMLDEPGHGDVTQAAFIRSLLASFIKSSDVGENRIGGLFGSQINDNEVVKWDRLQQGAFLIYSWQILEKRIKEVSDDWAHHLREINMEATRDPAFSGKNSLLSTDQGVRAFFHIINDMVYEITRDVDLNSIGAADLDISKKGEILEEQTINLGYIGVCLDQFYANNILTQYLDKICIELAHFDWRTSSAAGLSQELKVAKMAFRGSGGYKQLRWQLLEKITYSKDQISEIARSVIEKLGYNN